MAGLRLAQLKCEMDSWRRTLIFIQEETIHLKNRLTEILKKDFDKALLEEVENYQNLFLKEDVLLGLLRNDVAELERLLSNPGQDEVTAKVVEIKLDKLRKKIVVTERHFSKVKSEFNVFLTEHGCKPQYSCYPLEN